jgi:Undecaprenyl-phosphate glucose phosphotransferase
VTAVWEPGSNSQVCVQVMISLPVEGLSDAVPVKGAMHASAVEPSLAIKGSPLPRALDLWLSDRLGNVSRPKLLFTMSVVDALIIVLTGLAAFFVAVPGTAVTASDALLRTVIVALAAVAVLRSNWSYTVHALREVSAQIEKVVKSLIVVFCVVAGAAFLARIEFFSPGAVLLWLTLSVCALVGLRFAAGHVLEALTEQGRLVRRTVIVGGGPDAEDVISALEGDRAKEISILGIFDDRFDERSSDSISGYAKLGNFEQLADFCRNSSVDLLIVTVPVTAEERLMHILKKLFTLPVDVRISALSSKLRLNANAYSRIGGVPLLAVLDRPLTDWDRVLKNIEDKVLAVVLLLLAAPVMAIVALAVRFESKGPILFKQKRFGFNNELVEVWKFRSMFVEMSDATASKLVTKDDPRVTRVGRFIRRTSLDELPQFFNVLTGEVSLVGPRPHATGAKADADPYQTVVESYFARHRMKPGITGWAQINGWRGETDTHEKIQRRVECDLYYIDHWSVLFDLYIIAMTPLALLSKKNAY